MNTPPLTKEQCDNWRKAFPYELGHMSDFEINFARDSLYILNGKININTTIESSGAAKSLATLGDFFPA